MRQVLTWLIQGEACRSRFIAGVHREFRLRNRAAFDRGEAIASAGSDREHRRPIGEKGSTRAKEHYRQQEVPCISRHFRTLSFRDTSHPERDCIRATAARAAVRIPPPKACCKQMCWAGGPAFRVLASRSGTVGAPSLRSLQGRVRCCRYHRICYAQRTASHLRRSSPALYHAAPLKGLPYLSRFSKGGYHGPNVVAYRIYLDKS